MAGGQAITSGQGTVTQGNNQVRLLSRKVGGGTGTQTLSGVSTTSAAGLFTPAPQITPTGQVAALLQGSFAKTRTASLTGSSITSAAQTLSGGGPQRVNVSTAETSWLYASNIPTLYSKWTNPGGDWLDANNVFNGPTPYITQTLAAAGSHSFNISAIKGDILIRGINGFWGNTVTIDGVPATAFWVDASSGQSQAMPGRFGDPGFILNPARGTTLTFDTNAAGETVRIYQVAGPVVPANAMISTRATPNVASLQMLSAAQIQTAVAAAGVPIQAPYAFDDSFSTFNGMPYIRFAITPADVRGISWFWMFPAPLSEVYTRYCLFIENDVALGINNLAHGVKLPGPGKFDTSQTTVSWRMEHGVKDAANLNLYGAVDYRYNAETDQTGFGDIGDINSIFRAGEWYVVEQHAKANTYSGSIANPDGVAQVWINGNLLYSRTNVKWFGNGEQATAKFDNFYANVYQGGADIPANQVSQNIHYRLAEFGVSTNYIGPPDALVLPAWVPAAGTVATVGLNNILTDATVNPELDPATNPNSPVGPKTGPWFGPEETTGIGGGQDWSNTIFAPLLGSQGSMLMTMTGHEAYNDNAVYRYDLAAQKWMPLTKPYGSKQVPFRNGVTAFPDLQAGPAINQYSDVNSEYFASPARASGLQDQPAAFQSYDVNVYLPPGYGGAGAKGALLTTARYAASPNGANGNPSTVQQAHILDLAAAEANPAVGWARWGGSYLQGSGQSSACISQVRRKLYHLPGQSGTSVVIRVADLDTRVYSYLGLDAPGRGYVGHSIGDNMRYAEARDCLFVGGFSTPNAPSPSTFVFGVQVITIAGSTASILLPGMTGTFPTTRGGGEWVEELAAYFYNPGSGFVIYKVTLPAGDPTTNPWLCTPITLSGTTPIAQPTAAAHAARLRWSSAANCFIWHSSNGNPAQAFRLP